MPMWKPAAATKTRGPIVGSVDRGGSD
jgi:hypothetical protein